jgi:uncharacterized protein
MRGFMRTHPVVSYYAMAVTLAWAYWLTLIALGLHVGPGSRVSHLPGLLAPALAALIVTAATDGRNGLAQFLRRFAVIPEDLPLTVATIAAPLLVSALVVAGQAIAGIASPPVEAFLLYPGVPAKIGPLGMLSAVLVLNGFGEEAGWRGFATDRLLSGKGAVGATLVVAAMWAVWHLPLFVLVDNMSALIGPTLIGWVLGLVLGAFVLTDIYLRSGRSVLAVALWHTTYNLAVATPATAGLPAAVVSTLVMVWGVYAAWRLWRHPGLILARTTATAPAE